MSMASLSDERPVNPEDEQLVAYLDGELEPSERSDLEERLLNDETLRMRLQELQRSWDWLDQLPAATPSNKLVESTLELVVSDIVEAKAEQRSPLKRWTKPVAFIAACVLLPLLAVGLVHWQRSATFQRHLEELAIAENLQAYLEVENLQASLGNDENALNFVRELSGNDDWIQMIEAAREVGMVPDYASSIVAPIPLEQRAERLSELEDEKRVALAARWDRYTSLSADNREELWDTHRVVMQQTDSESLIKTMRDFAAWKAILPSDLADQIEGRSAGSNVGPQQSREQALAEAIAVTTRELKERSGSALTSASTRRIVEALEMIAIERISASKANRDEGTISHFEWAVDRVENLAEVSEEDPRKLALRYVLPWLVWPPHERDRWADRFDIETPPAPVSPAELETVETFALSASDRRVLDMVAGSDPSTRAEILRSWGNEAVNRILPWPQRDDTMLEMYLKRDPDERERLDLEDPGTFAERLSPDRHHRGRRFRSGRDRNGRRND